MHTEIEIGFGNKTKRSLLITKDAQLLKGKSETSMLNSCFTWGMNLFLLAKRLLFVDRGHLGSGCYLAVISHDLSQVYVTD